MQFKWREFNGSNVHERKLYVGEGTLPVAVVSTVVSRIQRNNRWIVAFKIPISNTKLPSIPIYETDASAKEFAEALVTEWFASAMTIPKGD